MAAASPMEYASRSVDADGSSGLQTISIISAFKQLCRWWRTSPRQTSCSVSAQGGASRCKSGGRGSPPEGFSVSARRASLAEIGASVPAVLWHVYCCFLRHPAQVHIVDDHDLLVSTDNC